MSELRFDPGRLIDKLVEHDVGFVVIGGIAATLHGSPVVTTDLDIAYERTAENIERLASALQEVHARLRGLDDVPFVPDARALRSGSNFTFVTDLGDLDCLGWPEGRASYTELRDRAVEMKVGGHRALVASLEDLIAMKKAAGRDKDRFGLLHLEAIKEIQASR